jgi:hypothetical protein
MLSAHNDRGETLSHEAMSTSWVQVFFNTTGMIAVINSVLWSLFLVPFSEVRQALRPYHNHDEIQKLSSGEIVPVDVEICPTRMVFEADHRLILEIEAHDSSDAFQFQYNDQDDRNPIRLAGTNTLYTGNGRDSFLLLPIIASQE